LLRSPRTEEDPPFGWVGDGVVGDWAGGGVSGASGVGVSSSLFTPEDVGARVVVEVEAAETPDEAIGTVTEGGAAGGEAIWNRLV
jgi:hypothetical protein